MLLTEKYTAAGRSRWYFLVPPCRGVSGQDRLVIELPLLQAADQNTMLASLSRRILQRGLHMSAPGRATCRLQTASQ